MLEDPKLIRMINSRQEAIAAMMQGYANRTQGCDRVVVDKQGGRISFFFGVLPRWTPRAELVGIFMTDIERWRWWWVMPGTETASGSRLDAAYAAGKEAGIDTLTARNPAVSTEKEAALLARLCASLAGAAGVHGEKDYDRVSYYALFPEDEAGAPGPANPQQYNTVLPPPSSRPSIRHPVMPPPKPAGGAPAMQSPLMSLFPGAHPSPDASAPGNPPAEKPVQLPARDLIRPVAQHAHGMVLQHMPDGFHQAVMVLYVEVRGGKLRFSALVVASDPRGNLTVLDPSTDLMQAVQTLLAEDARSGNGRWTRLTIHLTSTPSGAALDVHVKS
jgi:hypothetical protein